MTPDRINELITEIHEECKARGAWDGLLNYCDDPCDECHKIMADQGQEKEWDECNHERLKHENAYLAQKLDLITEAIVDAMRARWPNPKWGKNYGKSGWCGAGVDRYNEMAITDNGKRVMYKAHIDGTYEHHLALALLRTMDLMGFYGETLIEHTPIIMIYDNAVDYLRAAASAAGSLAEMTVEDSGIRNGALSGIVNRIIIIAELDEIDLERHLAALRKYMEAAK